MLEDFEETFQTLLVLKVYLLKNIYTKNFFLIHIKISENPYML